MAEEKISLNKYISATGYCSRREADKLIDQARVVVNGNIALAGTRVSSKDKVYIDDELLKVKSTAKQDQFIIAFNKPLNITSTTDEKDRTNIIRFINHPKRIFPIGRLDKDSEGLIFLTNDGDIVNKILRARNNHEKEYLVTVNKPINQEFVHRMSNGIPILDTVTRKCKVRQTGPSSFSIILTQGLNRQIRRMCEYLGFNVVRLKRIRIMNIVLDVPVGEWRYLTEKELMTINEMVADSAKTFEDLDRESLN